MSRKRLGVRQVVKGTGQFKLEETGSLDWFGDYRRHQFFIPVLKSEERRWRREDRRMWHVIALCFPSVLARSGEERP